MKKTRMAAILSLSFLTIQAAHSAQYRVVKLPIADLGKSSFPSAINNSGDVAVNLQSAYNPPIDVDLIDWDSSSIITNLTNAEAAESGDFNVNDYSYLYSYITANAESLFFQQIANYNAYIVTDDSADQVPGFDTVDAVTRDYTNSATTQIKSINDYGYAVGISQDGFYKIDYTNQSSEDLIYVVNDFYSRAFVQIGNKTVGLPPPDTTAGGLSAAYDINANNQIVGVGTTKTAESLQSSIDECADIDLRGDKPQAACLRSLSISLNSNVSEVSQLRGILWQIDDKGNVTDTYSLGMLITPDSTDSAIYSSTAVAINDYGIAVGQSPDYYLDTTSATTSAAIYINGNVKTINTSEDIYSSTAKDINNNNLVVGYASKVIDGSAINRFFVHDIDADLTTYPNGFFNTSASVATGINNQGMVVGYAEAEATIGTRRNEGFIYDYQNNIFNGLNSLLECNSPYSIVQANAINEDGEIAATAIVKGPARNITGEIALDSQNAETETDYVVAVKLVPIVGGSVDNCDAYVEKEVRQGASMSWLLMLGLVGIFFRAARGKLKVMRA